VNCSRSDTLEGERSGENEKHSNLGSGSISGFGAGNDAGGADICGSNPRGHRQYGFHDGYGGQYRCDAAY
jgi:hypothetical protein